MYKLVSVAVLLWLAGVVQAEIFQWQDADGKPYYSDRPRAGAKTISLKPGYSFHTIPFVYDGDTVRLDDGRKVRLLGVNTPEIEGRNKTGEAGGNEAKRWLTETLKGTRVRLQSDVEKQDKYGRTLAHLFTEQKRHINLELVQAGLATVNIYPPNLLYADALVAAQDEAEASGLGVWRRPEYAPKPTEQIVAGNYKGWQRVTGQVRELRQTRKFVYLKLTDHVDARIERKNLALFPDLDDYVGKPLELRGWLNRSKDHFSMLIRHPSAIKR